MTDTALAVSSGEPPPTATIPSASCARSAATPASTKSVVGSPVMSLKVAVAMPASSRLSATRPATPESTMTGSVTTRTRVRPLPDASSPTRSLTPPPTWMSGGRCSSTSRPMVASEVTVLPGSDHHPAQEAGRLEVHEDAHDEQEQEAPSHHTAEQIALPPAEADRGGADGEVLRGDHLAQDAARGVRRGHQHLVDAGVLRGGDLQLPAQRVRRRVRARHPHAEPADDRREEGEEAAGARRPQPQRRGLAGLVHDVRQREHGREGQDRHL